MRKKPTVTDHTPLLQLHHQTPNRLNSLQYWFSCHLRACLFSLGELIRYPIGNFITLFVIGIAFALPVILFELLQNGETALSYFHESPLILLYLKKDVSNNDVNQFIQTLSRHAQIETVHYISPDEGLQSLQADSSINAAVQALGSNPLPAVIEVVPNRLNHDPDTIQVLYDQLKLNPLVDTAQLNIVFVKRLFYFVALLKELTNIIAFIFFIGLILIVSNTIRLDMKSHQEEIYILQLIGATHAFIRRPLLYKGFFYGFIGSIIAIILGNTVLWRLEKPLSNLTLTYNSSFQLQGLSASQMIGFVACCALLGYLGSRWVANVFLRKEHIL